MTGVAFDRTQLMLSVRVPKQRNANYWRYKKAFEMVVEHFRRIRQMMKIAIFSFSTQYQHLYKNNYVIPNEIAGKQMTSLSLKLEPAVEQQQILMTS